MYLFYLGDTQFPVAPSKMQIKINNKNKTMTLINVSVPMRSGIVTAGIGKCLILRLLAAPKVRTHFFMFCKAFVFVLNSHVYYTFAPVNYT